MISPRGQLFQIIIICFVCSSAIAQVVQKSKARQRKDRKAGVESRMRLHGPAGENVVENAHRVPRDERRQINRQVAVVDGSNCQTLLDLPLDGWLPRLRIVT